MALGPLKDTGKITEDALQKADAVVKGPSYPSLSVCVTEQQPGGFEPRDPEVMVTIIIAQTEAAIRMAGRLFREYVRTLPFNLDFQDVDEELAHLARHYSPPRGRLYLALEDNRPVGCVALRDFGKGVCEMKRLYVRPSHRGRRVGRELVETVIEAACEIGYHHMRLDTVPAMKTANRLYADLGFKPVDAYRFNPVEGAIYLELKLSTGSPDGFADLSTE